MGFWLEEYGRVARPSEPSPGSDGKLYVKYRKRRVSDSEGPECSWPLRDVKRQRIHAQLKIRHTVEVPLSGFVDMQRRTQHFHVEELHDATGASMERSHSSSSTSSTYSSSSTLADEWPSPSVTTFSVHFCPLERTFTGLHITPEASEHCDPLLADDVDTPLLGDEEAACEVARMTDGFRRSNGDSRYERILRNLIHMPGDGRKTPLGYMDDKALLGVFSAANKIFFGGRLAGRVTWDWSHPSSSQYESRVIGTTALRRSERVGGGYETLIVLSWPILMEGGYSHRLLISTFLHEMIHSYLFVECGFKARLCGGHTKGFRDIARIIDDWVGPGVLHLVDMEADLERFRDVDSSKASHHGYHPRQKLPRRIESPRMDHDRWRGEEAYSRGSEDDLPARSEHHRAVPAWYVPPESRGAHVVYEVERRCRH